VQGYGRTGAAMGWSDSEFARSHRERRPGSMESASRHRRSARMRIATGSWEPVSPKANSSAAGGRESWISATPLLTVSRTAQRRRRSSGSSGWAFLKSFSRVLKLMPLRYTAAPCDVKTRGGSRRIRSLEAASQAARRPERGAKHARDPSGAP
jgi:hypothetical protein